MTAITLPDGESPWRLSDRADPAGVVIADRHYNRQKVGSPVPSDQLELFGEAT